MYDGGSMTSPMIGEYCDSTPPDIITTSNEIFVHFLTSPSYTDIGFKMMYSGDCCPNPNMVGNGICNDETNNLECNYDGGDCCGPAVSCKYLFFI